MIWNTKDGRKIPAAAVTPRATAHMHHMRADKDMQRATVIEIMKTELGLRRQ